jgi:hypothetical protein
MDAFEQVVAELLWAEGHWVRTSLKVELTKEEKRRIGRPSSPRWELDVVAYQGAEGIIRVVECKSYLDSVGVVMKAFDGSGDKLATRYKLFNDAQLREVVFQRLQTQLAESGACPRTTSVKLCLACGKIAREKDREALKAYFKKQDWELWDEHWLRERLRRTAKSKYENETSAVVAKLLLRGRLEATDAEG